MTPAGSASERSQGATAVAAVGLLAFGLYVVMLAGAQPSLGNPTLAILAQVGVGITVLVWAVIGSRMPRFREWGELGPVLLLCLVVALCSTILSPVPRIALGGFVGAVAVAAAYVFLRNAANSLTVRARLEGLLTSLPVVVGVAYVVVVGAVWIVYWQLAGGFGIPPLRPAFAALSLGSPNYVATLMIALTPFGAMRYLAAGRRGRAAAIGGLALVVVALAAARAAMLGGVVAALVIVVLALLRRRRDLGGRSLAGWSIVAVAGLALASTVVAQRADQGGVGIRVELWQLALDAFTTRPLLGTGPTTFPIMAAQVANGAQLTTAAPHAHNLYVQTLAELGVLGVLAAAVLVIAVGRLLFARVLADDEAVALPAMGAAAGIAAVGAQSLADMPTLWPTVTIPIVALIALVEASQPRSRRVSRVIGRRVWAVTWAMVVLLAVPFLAMTDAAWLQADAALAAANEEEWSEARQAASVAMTLDPMPSYRTQAAIAQANGGDRDEAIRLLDEVIAVDALPQYRIARAWLYLDRGRRDDALLDVRIAGERSQGDPVALMNVSRLAELLGDREFAMAAAAGAIAAAPTLAADAWWLEPERVSARERIIALAADRAMALTGTAQGSLVLAFAGDLSGAESIAGTVAPDRREALTAIVRAAASAPGGQEMLRSYVAQDPLDWYAAAWLSVISRRSDPSLAVQSGLLATLVQADSARGLVDTPARIGMGLPGRQFRLFGWPTNFYGRQLPIVLLPPEAITLGP